MDGKAAERIMIKAIQSFWNKYRWELIGLVCGFIVMNLIFIAEALRKTNTLNLESAGHVGDFVGGYVGSFFSLVGVLLLIRTLRTQVDANELQSFQTKYFELIRMHRDNVAELDLQDAKGRRIFVLLIREFRFILMTVSDLSIKFKLSLTQNELVHIAYYCLFFGTGPNSSRMLKQSLKTFDIALITELDRKLDSPEIKETAQRDLKLGYVPFDGHQSRLGHYYRHLYQVVCYVDSQGLAIDKREYVKMVRAQLSTHEQALLLINSLTPVGKPWWEDGLIVKYGMVKNLPQNFFDSQSEIDPDKIFPNKYFEWENAES